ncbi:uncharacterized protein LOC127239467 isoform X2 [Andrographis paniculata]|nr:uncharacterized protein LOC127239467 isoform X2 [Andrographis paniculata]
MDSTERLGELEGPDQKIDDQQGRSKVEDTWEECGCVLWDLAAGEDHAQFMIQNLILEVLLANLVVSQSSRITEISLGIIGNLACHEATRKQIASTNGLVKVIVEQLLLDDVPCLCEACRVLTLCLQGCEGAVWAEALQTEQMLSRIFWISENALNPQLIEKIVGLLLAIIESPQEVAATLLPRIMELNLPNLLIKLLAFEMSKLKEEQLPERYPVLDLILRAFEAISTMDKYSSEICLHKELMEQLKELIELPDKLEVSTSCVTAAVLIANMITEATDLVSELSMDVDFLQGLFDIFPFASDDVEAQSAIWSVIARILTVHESQMNSSNFNIVVSILASKLDLIEDELLAHTLGHEGQNTENASGTKVDVRLIAMKKISDILTRWKFSDDGEKNTSSINDCSINENVDKVLDLCQKAMR